MLWLLGKGFALLGLGYKLVLVVVVGLWVLGSDWCRVGFVERDMGKLGLIKAGVGFDR